MVWVLALSAGHQLKFTKWYADLCVQAALRHRTLAEEVAKGDVPVREHPHDWAIR